MWQKIERGVWRGTFSFFNDAFFCSSQLLVDAGRMLTGVSIATCDQRSRFFRKPSSHSPDILLEEAPKASKICSAAVLRVHNNSVSGAIAFWYCRQQKGRGSIPWSGVQILVYPG
eukprot:1158547-Pelagomonas_calceolata.AAC.1